LACNRYLPIRISFRVYASARMTLKTESFFGYSENKDVWKGAIATRLMCVHNAR